MVIVMVIKPAQLVDEPLALHLEIPEGQMEYAPDVRQTGPVTVSGRAELLDLYINLIKRE